MKICIISNSHLTGDVRLYHKLAKSLAQKAETYVLSGKGMINKELNPYQIIVDADSPNKILPSLYRECMRIKPDIVIPVEPLTVPVALLLRRRLGCRVIWDIHEFFAYAHGERYHFLLRPFVRFAYLRFRACAGSVDFITAVNLSILQQLLRQDILKHIVCPIIRAGLDVDQDIRTLSTISPDEFRPDLYKWNQQDRDILQLLSRFFAQRTFPCRILIIWYNEDSA